jgi:hypothetical protein
MNKDNFIKLTNAVYKVLEFFPESDPLKNRAKDKALAIMEHLVLVNETSGWASFQKEKVKVQILEDIDVLLGYLWIAKTQGWLNSMNYFIVANEYEKIKKDIKLTIDPVTELVQKFPDMATFALQKIEENPHQVEKTGTQIQPSSVLSKTETNVSNLFTANPDEVKPVSDEGGTSARQNPPSYEITARQEQIIEFLTKNNKAQVMDIQTILPDITKRTIRRDLYELLESGKITRSGDFNQVFYQIKK